VQGLVQVQAAGLVQVLVRAQVLVPVLVRAALGQLQALGQAQPPLGQQVLGQPLG
jgi:hypothetical protein